MSIKRILFLFLFVGLAVSHGEARAWDALAQLPAGATVEVIHGGLKRASGTLVEATSEGITVRTADGINVIARNDVRRVSVMRKSRKKRALLGAAMGAGVGALALALGANSGDIDIRRDIVVGAGAAAGADLGAAVGAATGGPETIYRAP